MAGQHLLHFAGRDVLPAPDDDVLDSIGDHEVAVLVETGQIAGAEPGGMDERVGVGRRVLVTEELLGSAGHDLALLAGCHVDFVLVEQAHLVARGHPTVGQAPLVGRVGGATGADGGVLGRAIGAPGHDAGRLAAGDQFRWHGRRAAEEALERRDVAP